MQNPALPALTLREIRSIMIGLMLAVLLGALEQTIVAVALPQISRDLQGLDLLAWVMAGYLLAVAVSTPIYGKLGDLYGRRKVLSAAILIFLFSSVMCALADSMAVLVAGRILQGIGGGGLISVSQAATADVISARDRGRYQGYISGSYALASVAGPILGALLTMHFSWRAIFWINVPLGLAALFICRRALVHLPVPHVRRPIDWLGAILLTGALTALLIGVTRIGQGVSWASSENLQLFVLGALLLAGFTWQAGRAEEPLIPLTIVRERAVTGSCLLLFIAFFEVVSLSVMVPLRLQMTTGAALDRAAFELIPLTLGVPVAAFCSGWLLSRVGRCRPFQLGGAALVIPAVLGLALIDPGATLPQLICMGLAGLGLGAQMPASVVAVQNAVASQHVGIATSTSAFFRSFGAAVGVAILTALLLAALRATIPAMADAQGNAEMLLDLAGKAMSNLGEAERMQVSLAVHDAFRKIFLVSAGVACISLVTALLMRDETLHGGRPGDI